MIDVDITTDGRTVWVNADRCLGRFTANMAEVFNGYRTFDPDWVKWVDAIRVFHGVTVPDRYRPDWTREDAACAELPPIKVVDG